MEKTARPFLPTNRQGIGIDIVAILANLFLFPLLLSRVGHLFDESFANDNQAFMTLAGLMLFTLVARLGGLYLKRFPLQTRLEKTRRRRTSFPLYFFVLNFGVFVLNSAFVVVLFSTVAGDTGFVQTYSDDGIPRESSGVMGAGLIIIIALVAAETILIYALTRPLSKHQRNARAEGNWKYTGLGEFLADFGLFSYMMVWQVFYNDTAKLLMTPPENTPDTWQYRIFSAGFLFIAFLIFYVSPRAVFLIEDRKYIGTWVFIFAVYLASVLRYW